MGKSQSIGQDNQSLGSQKSFESDGLSRKSSDSQESSGSGLFREKMENKCLCLDKVLQCRSKHKGSLGGYGKIFFVTFVLQVLILLVTTSIVIILSATDGKINTSDRYTVEFYGGLTLFILSAVTYFVWDGLAKENKFQLMAGVVVSLVETLWTAYHYVQHDFPSTVFEDFSLALTILDICCFVVFCVLLKPVMDEFGWRVFQKIGACKADQDMYREYLKLKTLLRLDACAVTLVMVFGAIQILNMDTIPTIIAGVGWVVLLFLNGLILFGGAKNETRWKTQLFLCTSWLPIAAFGFGIGYWYLHEVNKVDDASHMSGVQFLSTGAVMVAIRIYLGLSVWKVQGAFGKGLKYKLTAENGDQSVLAKPDCDPEFCYDGMSKAVV